jgi:hypothetical protein
LYAAAGVTERLNEVHARQPAKVEGALKESVYLLCEGLSM